MGRCLTRGFLLAPLFALRMSMEPLHRESVDGVGQPAFLTSVRRHVDRALRSIDRMTAIVNDLLDGVRIESGMLRSPTSSSLLIVRRTDA